MGLVYSTLSSKDRIWLRIGNSGIGVDKKYLYIDENLRVASDCIWQPFKGGEILHPLEIPGIDEDSYFSSGMILVNVYCLTDKWRMA
jgi:hypothetical protein